MRRIRIAAASVLALTLLVAWIALMELEFDRAGWTDRGGPMGLVQGAITGALTILAVALPVVAAALAIYWPITWLSRARTRRRIEKLSRR